MYNYRISAFHKHVGWVRFFSAAKKRNPPALWNVVYTNEFDFTTKGTKHTKSYIAAYCFSVNYMFFMVKTRQNNVDGVIVVCKFWFDE